MKSTVKDNEGMIDINNPTKWTGRLIDGCLTCIRYDVRKTDSKCKNCDRVGGTEINWEPFKE